MSTAKNAKRNPRTWLVTVLLSAAVLAYVFLMFLPGQHAIADLRAQLQQKQQYLLQSDLLSNTLQQLEVDLRTTHQYGQQWRDDSPRSTQVAQLYGQISEQARISNVAIRRFEPRPVATMNTLDRHTLLLETEGSFHQTFDFVRRLEQLPTTLWITDLEMGKLGDNRATLRSRLNLTIFADNYENSH